MQVPPDVRDRPTMLLPLTFHVRFLPQVRDEASHSLPPCLTAVCSPHTTLWHETERLGQCERPLV